MARAASLTRPDSDWSAALLLTAGLTLARVVALFRTPLQLYPDEAQYWLWSRALDFGYYSKPPMIAWAIWATTALGGDAEAWVRLAAPLFQAGATLAVFALGRRLYGGAAGFAAAGLYALMPAVQISSAVMATDAPLLFFLGLTLVAYAELQSAEGGGRLAWAAGVGAALGLGFLSKYAAVYAVIGIVLHLIVSREARRAWTPGAALIAIAVFALVLAPNLAWNAAHGFATFHHTAANAAWGQGGVNPAGPLAFLASQFAVFGPIPFGALIAGLGLAVRRRALAKPDLLLLCFTLPPVLIVAGQAFLSRANANWSGASYLPGAVLVAAWLVRWRARRWLAAAVATQAALAAFVLLALAQPRIADALGASNSLKRVRGWSETTRLVIDRAQAVQANGGLSAVAVNDRFLFYTLAYYGRGYFGRPGAPPLVYWLLTASPQNQAEMSAPLTLALGARVLGVIYEGFHHREMLADFAAVPWREIDHIGLDRKHQRRIDLFIGEGYRPQPRDPVTGLPKPSSSRPTPP
ncbi:MAG TPA: glycosyltransferase family 39 protein [Phenylobacterium sp.]|uniref:ArnT family glycosyltransferase n=1 Tax=Phenylobacterium sp. TaxID=1871053 RepID=UPI002C818747|nr:glycosyltransferase family 39 protein [Phenylobacterium sp.]HSV02974.1 glycosyltransferase family 39 protein [Phenylobacterium sp.]